MNKYYYVVKNEAGIHYIGFYYGCTDVEEKALVEMMQDYCKDKSYTLTLLVQIITGLFIVNQVYPAECTEESRMCLQEVLKVAL